MQRTKNISLPPEQIKFVEDTSLNLSRFVQKRLKELMAQHPAEGKTLGG